MRRIQDQASHSEFWVLAECVYEKFKKTIVLSIYAEDKEGAGYKANRILNGYENLTGHRILEISEQRITLFKFQIKVHCAYFQNIPAKTIKLNITAKNQSQAEIFAKELLGTWKYLYQYKILKISDGKKV